jgi:hypothetical protein
VNSLLIVGYSINFMSSTSSSLIVQFRLTLSLWISCLLNLSVTERRVLKSLTILVDLSIYLTSSISHWIKFFMVSCKVNASLCYILFEKLMYLSRFINSHCSWQFALFWTQLCLISIQLPSISFVYYNQYIYFLYPFPFDLPASLNLKWVNYRWYCWIIFLLFFWQPLSFLWCILIKEVIFIIELIYSTFMTVCYRLPL